MILTEQKRKSLEKLSDKNGLSQLWHLTNVVL
jgi:hypothetical protein